MEDLLNNKEIFRDLQTYDFLDKDRLLKWLKKCDILDKIEESELINFATKKRINNLIKKNANLKR